MSENKSILVVEDEEKIRRVIVMYLEKAGFTVRETGNGSDVQALIKAHKPDLIILDIMLPGLSGYEICRMIKSDEDTRDIIVMILSAKGQEWEKTEGYQVGADLYETKPFIPRQLVEKVKSIVYKN